MFDGIRVHHGALAQGSSDLLGAARSIQGRLDALEGELRPLAGDWSGHAREAYDVAKARWDAAISEMIVLLHDTSVGVEASNAAYQAADQRGAQRF